MLRLRHSSRLRLVCASVLACALFAVPLRSRAEETLPRVVRESVVRIVHQLPEEACLGTGTLISHERDMCLVVTCAHLFTEGEGETFIIGADGSPRRALVAAIDEKNDLACLLVPSATVRTASIATRRPAVGATLTWCGYGEEGIFRAKQGELNDYVTLTGGETRGVLEVTGAARHGDSGGPVFNQRGQLVAVIMGTDGTLVDGTHCDVLHDFLSQHPVTAELRAKAASLETLPVPDRLLALARAFGAGQLPGVLSDNDK